MESQKYTEWQREFNRILWAELAPMADAIEDAEHIDREALWPILKRLEAFGLLIPEEYGGLGLTISQYIPVIAEFAKVHGGIRAIVHVHNSMAHALQAMGTPEQAGPVLKRAATGERSVAFALTEPGSGTGKDVGTTATWQDDHFELTGQKWLITNSDFASHFLVFAQTRGNVNDGVSVFLVSRESPGMTTEPLPETMGCKGGEHGVVTFDRVRLSCADLLSAEGEGIADMEEALEISRVLVAASSLGTAEYALELSLEFAKSRVTFGKPIAERQAIQRYLAEMVMDVDALRLLVDDAASKWDAGARIPREASVCKLFGLEAVGRVTDRALLVHGGIGYTRRHQIERLYRDARLNWLEEGTPTIQQMVIARAVLNPNDKVAR